jgi:hypothetical protein
MKKIISLVVSSVLCASVAQAHTDDATSQQVVVRTLRNPEGMAYSSFIAAQKAYEEHRHYAPDAPLLFQMKTHSGTFDNLRLSVEGDHTDIPVAYDENGQFTLPYDNAALQDNAILTTNKKRGQIYWSPSIRTPGLPDNTLRLGDLRLYCRVKWALEKAAATLETKMMTALSKNCESSTFNTLGLPQPGMRVRLLSKDREEVLAVEPDKRHYASHRTRWYPPFGNVTWPDDTRVEFLPPEAGFVLNEECRLTREKDAADSYRHSYGTFKRDSCVWRPN